MNKGTLLITKKSNSIYQIVGRWDSDIVLMPTNERDDQVLIYGPGELAGLIKEGHFRVLHEDATEGGEA